MDKAKKICSNHGVKGFRKLKLKRPVYVAGKQSVMLNPHIATRLIDELVKVGYIICNEVTVRELATKGHLDCVSITY